MLERQEREKTMGDYFYTVPEIDALRLPVLLSTHHRYTFEI